MKHSLKIHVSKRTQVAGQMFIKMDGVEPRFFVTCYEEGVNCHINVI